MITVDSFSKSCGCRSCGECHHNSSAELEALDALVDAFAAEMKKKLRRKALAGRSGWDDPGCVEGIRAALLEHVLRGGQEVDIANLAAMLWNMATEQPVMHGLEANAGPDDEHGCFVLSSDTEVRK